jgi:hypothetical protein
VADFLARKMRKILVIQDTSTIQDNYEVVNITDPENNKYQFKYNPKGLVSGLHNKGLTYEYFDDLGLLDEVRTYNISEEVVVTTDCNLRKRINSFSQFRVYLVRYYPKSRDRIYKFFEDLEKHYNNYMLQFLNMLRNTSYTLTSLMIEWGDYSLKELLDKYFVDEDLKREFLLNDFINGLNCEEINSYNFFSNFFIGLKSGFDYLDMSEKEIRDILIKKIQLINPNYIIKTRVKEINLDEDGKVRSIVDKDNNEYTAKFFFVESHPIKFYTKFFDPSKEDMDLIKLYYPNIDKKSYINTLYLALNQNPKSLGIQDLVYYFYNQKEEPVKIVKVFNYSNFMNEDKRGKKGQICIDFTYNESSEYTPDELLRRVYEIFPKLKKSVVGIKEGKPRLHLTMLSKKRVRKNLTINELIDIEEFEHVQVFENLYLGNKYYRPEAGIFGIFNQAIIFADKLEDRLYFGEEDDVYQYLNNEEIMMMIRHNFDYKVFGDKEMHVNFHIGKNTYFVRTKGKNIVIHKGKYSLADIAIYTTNDRLSNLLLKKISLREVLDEGSFKFRGDTEVLNKVVEAFNLDDYQEYNPLDYKKSKYKGLGAKFLYAYFFVFFLTAMLANFVNGIFIYPVALLFGGAIAYLKYRSYEEVNWFDIFINFIFLTGTVLSISWTGFNNYRGDDYLLGLMSFVLIMMSLFNQPVVYNYVKFDKNVDYRHSLLFRIITNGLTFIWGFLLLGILVGTYISGERYVTVLYNAYFLGVFLTYFYPIIYVNTSIKK